VSAVLELPIARLATALAPLRGPRTDAASALAPMPVRVAVNDDGTYEVLDGFTRVASWTRDGRTHGPVVVEDAVGVVRKARLLEANAPRRTLSPMDEAPVVRSLADADRLTPAQIPSCSAVGAAGSIAASPSAAGSRRSSPNASITAGSRRPLPSASRRSPGPSSRIWSMPSCATGCARARRTRLRGLACRRRRRHARGAAARSA
jgi:hypothetical protein